MGSRELLVSTFSRLLRVHLDSKHQLSELEILRTGEGIYFGLTRSPTELYVVARNRDVAGEIQNPSLPTSMVLAFPWPLAIAGMRRFTVERATDLHQARYHDGLLWLVDGSRPELRALDPTTGRQVGQMALSDAVPTELAHDAPESHPSDRYHFNSIHFAAERCFILAHNWAYGSFALELRYDGPASLLERPAVIRAHTGLGSQSHDVYLDKGRLLVLDSGNCRLVNSNGTQYSISQQEDRSGYLRGLAVGGDFLYVGQGSFSDDRKGRTDGPSWLLVLERHTLNPAAAVELGRHGNPCDVLLTSEPDWSDQ